jgi:hypothetical protein
VIFAAANTCAFMVFGSVATGIASSGAIAIRLGDQRHDKFSSFSWALAEARNENL